MSLRIVSRYHDWFHVLWVDGRFSPRKLFNSIQGWDVVMFKWWIRLPNDCKPDFQPWQYVHFAIAFGTRTFRDSSESRGTAGSARRRPVVQRWCTWKPWRHVYKYTKVTCATCTLSNLWSVRSVNLTSDGNSGLCPVQWFVQNDPLIH